MDTQLGKNFTRIIDDLCKNAPRYSVFYAIYLAERILKKIYSERNTEILEQYGLKFQPFPEYVFPASNIRSCEFKEGEIKFVINFLGLYGIDAPLPRCYHEQVAIQQSIYGEGKIPLQNFYDIFNNRFYWLYFNAWKKYRYYLQLSEKKTSQRVFSFMGLIPTFKSKDLTISHLKYLRVSGVLCNRVRNKSGLLILLNEFFPRYNFDLQEFIPAMIPLSERPQLGQEEGGFSFELGTNSILGEFVLDYMSKVRLIISSITFEDYLHFTQDGKYFLLLKHLMDLYLSDGMTYDVKLLVDIQKTERLPFDDERVKLGFSMWLGQPKLKSLEFHIESEKFARAG